MGHHSWGYQSLICSHLLCVPVQESGHERKIKLFPVSEAFS